MIKTVRIMSMMKLCASIFCFLFPLASFAQSKIGYIYDEAGNRLRREIVVQAVRESEAGRQTFGSEKQTSSDMRQGHSIKIYPNPSEGKLMISVSGLKDSDKTSYGIYTAQGAQITAGNTDADNFNIDISSRPAGVYLLKIVINDNPTTWKIIKR